MCSSKMNTTKEPLSAYVRGHFFLETCFTANWWHGPPLHALMLGLILIGVTRFLNFLPLDLKKKKSIKIFKSYLKRNPLK